MQPVRPVDIAVRAVLDALRERFPPDIAQERASTSLDLVKRLIVAVLPDVHSRRDGHGTRGFCVDKTINDHRTGDFKATQIGVRNDEAPSRFKRHKDWPVQVDLVTK